MSTAIHSQHGLLFQSQSHVTHQSFPSNSVSFRTWNYHSEIIKISDRIEWNQFEYNGIFISIYSSHTSHCIVQQTTPSLGPRIYIVENCLSQLILVLVLIMIYLNAYKDTNVTDDVIIAVVAIIKISNQLTQL